MFLATSAVKSFLWIVEKLLTAENAEKIRGGRGESFMHSAELTQHIIGAAIKVHRRLGPGLLESAYEVCLAHEIGKLVLRVERQKAVPLIYEAVKLDCAFRAEIWS